MRGGDERDATRGTERAEVEARVGARWWRVPSRMADNVGIEPRPPLRVSAMNIADGSVSDDEFQRLDGVLSSIQAQINAISSGPAVPISTSNGGFGVRVDTGLTPGYVARVSAGGAIQIAALAASDVPALAASKITAGTDNYVLTSVSGVSTWAAAASGGVALGDTPTWTGVHTFLKTAIGTAQTADLTIQNTTAAAAGAQQYSPGLVLEGRGWATGAGASQASQWLLQNRPVQGTTLLQDLVLYSSINGAAYTEALKIGQVGTYTSIATTGSQGLAIVGGNAAHVYLQSNAGGYTYVQSYGGGKVILTGTAGVELQWDTTRYLDIGVSDSTMVTLATGVPFNGKGGIQFMRTEVLMMDIGVTSASNVTLAGGKSFVAAAGSGALNFGSASGDTTLGTGNFSATLALNKTISLVAQGASGTVTVRATDGQLNLSAGLDANVDAGTALNLAPSSATSVVINRNSGGATTIGGQGQIFKVAGTTVADIGITSASSFTLAANKGLTFAAGSGSFNAGSASGDTTLGTGSVVWNGAANKTAGFTGSGASAIVGMATTNSYALVYDQVINISAGTSGVHLQSSGSDILVTTSTGATVSTGKVLALDSGTATGSGLAVTLNKQVGVITTESLSTPAQTSDTYTINNSLVSSSSRIFCQAMKGANTVPYALTNVTPGSGFFTVQIYNLYPSGGGALNGTVVFSFLIL